MELQIEADPRPSPIRNEIAVARLRSTIEEEVLDADMVMEPFKVPGGPGRTGEMNVQRGRAMGRQRDVVGLAQGRRDLKTGGPEAARRIRLEDIDGAGFKQAPE